MSFSNERRFCRAFFRLLKTQMDSGDGGTGEDYMRDT